MVEITIGKQDSHKVTLYQKRQLDDEENLYNDKKRKCINLCDQLVDLTVYLFRGENRGNLPRYTQEVWQHNQGLAGGGFRPGQMRFRDRGC